MKIERKKVEPEFLPVHIVIEYQKELDDFFKILNWAEAYCHMNQSWCDASQLIHEFRKVFNNES